ncbi:MAG TPA: hypothetical protein HA340_02365, partial [Candidatus Thalassarchaeaceae archaeon]
MGDGARLAISTQRKLNVAIKQTSGVSYSSVGGPDGGIGPGPPFGGPAGGIGPGPSFGGPDGGIDGGIGPGPSFGGPA